MYNFQKGLVSILDLTREDIELVLKRAGEFKNGLSKNTLESKVIASCFFEPSTRTRLSFESSVCRLNGKVIGFADSNATSTTKGERFVDTIRMLNGYADGIIIRSPYDGAAKLASEISTVPVINAGDGANQHPTQTLLDLFSIQDSQGKLDGIHIGLMGDLKYSRTIHSLLDAAKLFNMQIYFIAPAALRIDKENLIELRRHGISYSFHNTAEEVIDKLDCLYLTRVQKERFGELNIEPYKITLKTLRNAKPNLKIMHPLPRVDELPVEIDDTPYAYYFTQAKNGVYVRQALLDMIFEGSN